MLTAHLVYDPRALVASQDIIVVMPKQVARPND